MHDSELVRLFLARDEKALSEAEQRYHRYLYVIAFAVLNDSGDAEECVNDALLSAWNSIPPHEPQRLSAYLAKLTRRISLNRLAHRTAQKRGGGLLEESLEELSEVLPEETPDPASSAALSQAMDAFLRERPKEERTVFLQRYFYLCSVKDIAKRCGFTESKVKMILHRNRKSYMST